MKALQTILLACSLLGTQAYAATQAPDSVLIIGDSLSSAHRMPAEAGWVHLMEQRLSTETTTPPTIVNASRGGKTLGDALGELPALLEQHHPDVVVIELGGNDAIMGGTADAIRRDLGRLVDMAQGADAQVVILGFEIPPAFDKDGSATLLRDSYVQIAKNKHVVLLPSLLSGISNDPALLQDDGIHPSAAAQPRVLDNAWSTLRPVLLAHK